MIDRECNAFTRTGEAITETMSSPKQEVETTTTLNESVHDREQIGDRERIRERNSRLDG